MYFIRAHESREIQPGRRQLVIVERMYTMGYKQIDMNRTKCVNTCTHSTPKLHRIKYAQIYKRGVEISMHNVTTHSALSP